MKNTQKKSEREKNRIEKEIVWNINTNTHTKNTTREKKKYTMFALGNMDFDSIQPFHSRSCLSDKRKIAYRRERTNERTNRGQRKKYNQFENRMELKRIFEML